ncbi:MAG TPA: hypothetical protein VF508_04140, partial [Pyrinomonadaceae bacterium]
MSASTRGHFYLLSTMEFDVGGTRVKLYGAVEATASEFTFVLSKDMAFDTALLPAGDATKSIDAPFGMKGVRLQDFDLRGRIYKDASGKTDADLTLSAAALFTSPALSNFRLGGALVFEQTTPRLALVAFSADQPLTITQLVRSVVGGTWDWADGVTDQFAFRRGLMYYLQPPPDSPSDYKYTYRRAQGGPGLVCLPGYRLDASLRIFGRYDFDIQAAVVGDAVSLSGTTGKLDFDFVTLTNSRLEISTSPAGKYLRVSTTVSVLDTTASAAITAAYDLTRKSFLGSVTIASLTVTFTWTQDSGGGLQIVGLGGLPDGLLNLVEQFTKVLNELRGGGCEKILGDWLNGLSQTTLTPALNGSPVKTGSSMKLPLKLTYAVKMDGRQIASSVIPFDAIFTIPKGLSDLPAAMLKSFADSSLQIAGDILSNPDTYKAVALEVAKKAGAQALARFICRALQQFAEDVAKQLASEAAKFFANATLSAAAELAGMVAAVALLGLNAVVSFFEEIWDEIKKLFGGGDDKKEEAERRIRDLRSKVAAAMQPVWDK